MKAKLLSLVLTLLWCSLAVLLTPLGAAAEKYVLGELVIKMAPGHDLQEVHNQFGTISAQHLEQLDIYLINAGSSTDLDSLAALIEATGLVAFCQPNYRVDPLQPVQSSLPVSDDLGQGSFAEQAAATRLELSSAHEYATGSNIRVAVLDGGIDYTHPALAGVAASGYDYVTDDADAMDEPGGPNSGHGTFVSGVVHLVAPSAEIRAYRVTDLNGESNGYLVAEAIMRAVNDSCRIINLSMVTMAQHGAMVDAIAYAAANDVLVVVAAGNGHDGGTAYPASDPNAFAVAAIDTTDQLADFSNFGDYVDICAPGTEIYSAYLDHGYAWWGGTSFAAPFVTAQAALLLDFNPEATRQDVIDAISATAEDIYDANGEFIGQLGAGLIDPLQSLIAIRNGAVSISVPGDYPTIQAAINAALIGDTVIVGPGIYAEPIVISQKLVNLISRDGPGFTTLEAAGPGLRTVHVTNIALGEATVSGFSIRGTSGVPTVEIFNSEVKLTNCFFSEINAGNNNVIFVHKSSLDISRCSFNDNQCYSAISFYPEHKWAAISMHNNTFLANPRVLFVNETAYPLDTLKITMANNIFAGTEYEVVGFRRPIVRGHYNLFWNNGSDYPSEFVGNFQNALLEDPLFLWTDTAALWLQVNSPAIDAGDPDPMQNDPDGSRNDIGAFPLGDGYPAALDLSLTGAEHGNVITHLSPTFAWTYQDIDALPQQSFEIQVGTDNDWSVPELWASGPVAGSNQSIAYAGSALDDFSKYYVRLRVNNGTNWGPWFNFHFVTSLGTLLRVPLDLPTISDAIVRASDDDTVLVADGIWTEDLILPARRIQLYSENGGATTEIQSATTCISVDSTDIEKACTVRGFTLRATQRGVDIDEMGAITVDSVSFIVSGTGIDSERLRQLVVTRCVFDSGGRAVQAHQGDVSITHSVFKNLDDWIAVGFSTCKRVEFADNVLHHNSGYRVMDIHQVDSVFMTNNTFVNNDAEQAIRSYSAAWVTCYNNLIVYSGQSGIYVASGGALWDMQYNNVYGHQTNYFGFPDTLLPANLSINPILADTAIADYSLLPGSPCIDAGHPDPLFNDPDGSRADIGGVWTPQLLTHPLAGGITVTPINSEGNVTDTLPQINWTYLDTTGGAQILYHIQVGTDHDWAAAEVWDSGPVSSSATTLTYTGPPLTPFHPYSVRVRLNNGSAWGSWTHLDFFVRFNATIRIPAHYSSITQAVPWTETGDTILVAPGVYAEEVKVEGRELTFISEQGADSTFLVPLTDSTVYLFEILNTNDSNTVFRGFTFDGADVCVYIDRTGMLFEHNVVKSAGNYGVYVDDTRGSVRIRHNIFTENNQALRSYRILSPLYIDSNLFVNNTSRGAAYIDGYGRTVEIVGNVFARNSSPDYLPGAGGMLLTKGVVTVQNNTFYDNGPDNSDIRIWPDNYGADIRNNIFGFARGTSLRIDDSSKVTLAYNNHFGADEPNIGIGSGEGDISADPLFADTASDDFTLLPGSPCIDAGDTSFAFMEPDFSRIDMGAFSSANGGSGVEVDTIGVIGEDATHILDSLPTIAWQASGDYSEFEIQVGTDLTWGDSTDWLPGVIALNDTAIAYTGSPLPRSIDHAVRVRVYDGTTWGPWAGRFIRRNGLLPVTASTPSGNREGLEVVLVAGGGDEPDGDSVLCDFELYADSGLTTLLESYSAMPNRRSPVIDSLSPLTDYWWRVRPFDGFEQGPWTGLTRFKTLDIGGRVELNLPQDDGIPCGQSISFIFDLVNNTEDTAFGVVNGFRIYSPDGASFSSAVGSWIDSVVDFSWQFRSIRGVSTYSGGGEDTIGFFGLAPFGPGLQPGMAAPAYSISTQIDCTELGKTLCINKSLYGPANTGWLWEFPSWNTSTPKVPAWDGPFCFTIEECCVDTRGDVNGDGVNANMTDLTWLVSYLFQAGPPPPCMAEANINADVNGQISLSDITMMVNSMFVTFAPFPPCTQARVAPPAGHLSNPDIQVHARYDNDSTIITLNSAVDLLGLQLRLVGGEGTTPRLLVDGPFGLYHNFADQVLTIGMLDINTGAALEAGSQDVIKIAGRWEIADAGVADRNHRDLAATIGQSDPLIPSRFELAQNYPNPFNPSTTIKFGLPVAADVRLEIVNILGQRVATVVDREFDAGYHEVVWDGTSLHGEEVASGVYFYRLRAGSFSDSRKMLLLK